MREFIIWPFLTVMMTIVASPGYVASQGALTSRPPDRAATAFIPAPSTLGADMVGFGHIVRPSVAREFCARLFLCGQS